MMGREASPRDNDDFFKSLLRGPENPDTCLSLSESLQSRKRDGDLQRELLLMVDHERRYFVSAIANWGGDSEDAEKAFQLLVELFRKDKWSQQKNPAEESREDFDDESNGTLNPPIMTDDRVLARVIIQALPDVILETGDNNSNLVLTVVREGMTDMARVVIRTIEEVRGDKLAELMEEENDSGDTALKYALHHNLVPLVRFLARWEDSDREGRVLMAVERGKITHLKILLENRFDQEELLKYPVLQAAAKAGAATKDGAEVWDLLKKKRPQLMQNADLLKQATESRQLEIVADLLDTYPGILNDHNTLRQITATAVDLAEGGFTSKQQKKAVSKSRMKQKEEEAAAMKKKSEEIRVMILERMIRTMTPRDFKSCWPKSNAKEVCLELTSPNNRRWAWLVSFIKTAAEEVKKASETVDKQTTITPNGPTRHSGKFNDSEDTTVKNINETITKSLFVSKFQAEFQPVLKYVSFGDLDEMRKHPSAEHIRHLAGTEVKHVLQWLRVAKGVQKIMDLRVLDSQQHPHSEETIEEALMGIEVDEFNWKRFDISARTLKISCPNASRIQLYSSGNWAALYHWMSTTGLNSLEANKVRVAIITDLITSKRAEDQETELENWFKKDWKHSTPSNESTPEAEDPESRPYRVERLPWITAGPQSLDDPNIPSSLRDPRTVIKLQKFLQYVYRRRQERRQKKRELKPVKIAIIDTGIDSNQFEVSDFKGETFSQRDSDTHWWLSSDSHGTQMAKLILSIDPYSKLYIAKVGDSKNDITVGAVANAVEWAIGEGVDIISMSFALEHETNDLKKAIRNAANAGIVLMCSTADEGANRPKAWPACSDGRTIKIAACDEGGNLAQTSSTEAEFYFQGERIILGGSQVGDIREEVSGSSVATAIASGVASLALACHQIDYGIALERNDLHGKVKEWFKAMKGMVEGKYVRPWVVFGDKERASSETMFLPLERRNI